MTLARSESCTTCELIERRDAGNAPPWDCITRTPGWDVVHAFGTAIEGWTVLVVRRHITAVADLTDGEAGELGHLVRSVSRGIQEIIGCEKTYVVQFAEAAQHSHVHFHVIPRDRDLPGPLRGPGIFGLLGVPADECVTEARMNNFAAELWDYLGRLQGVTG